MRNVICEITGLPLSTDDLYTGTFSCIKSVPVHPLCTLDFIQISRILKTVNVKKVTDEELLILAGWAVHNAGVTQNAVADKEGLVKLVKEMRNNRHRIFSDIISTVCAVIALKSSGHTINFKLGKNFDLLSILELIQTKYEERKILDSESFVIGDNISFSRELGNLIDLSYNDCLELLVEELDRCIDERDIETDAANLIVDVLKNGAKTSIHVLKALSNLERVLSFKRNYSLKKIVGKKLIKRLRDLDNALNENERKLTAINTVTERSIAAMPTRKLKLRLRSK